MNEFVKAVTDLLGAVLPAGYLGWVLTLLALVFLVLVATGQFKLKWIGSGVRHAYRWLRCKTRDKHYYYLDGIGSTNLSTGRSRGTYVCAVCSKVQVLR